MEEKLFPVSEESYGPEYKTHLLEMYKLYVEMADRVSSRRQRANSFYLAVNTGIIGAATFFHLPGATGEGSWLIAIAGVLLCVMWIRNIQSYKDLNQGKFQIINLIEQRLPIAPYETEWDVLQRGETKSIYRPFHIVERYVPLIFILLYITFIVISIDWSKIWSGLISLWRAG